jgi:hypothetical protein
MPFVKDFSNLTGKGSFDLEIPNWSPLTIEYGYEYMSVMLYFFWRIRGTTHTFKINYMELMELTQGNYDEHISEFLSEFRKEYLGWATNGFQAEWMRDYHQEYRNFIQL